eukprot:8312270-Alexandrium_andersonii.AAC.1
MPPESCVRHAPDALTSNSPQKLSGCSSRACNPANPRTTHPSPHVGLARCQSEQIGRTPGESRRNPVGVST